MKNQIFRTLKPITTESRRLHVVGAFLEHDIHLSSENIERVIGLAMEAQNGTTTDQMRAAFDRVGAYGFGL
jgi:hypothetical protein